MPANEWWEGERLAGLECPEVCHHSQTRKKVCHHLGNKPPLAGTAAGSCVVTLPLPKKAMCEGVLTYIKATSTCKVQLMHSFIGHHMGQGYILGQHRVPWDWQIQQAHLLVIT